MQKVYDVESDQLVERKLGYRRGMCDMGISEVESKETTTDRELVIKIPEELYKTYKDRPPMLGDAGMDTIAQAIANGTPLPKGHGRLKDENYFLNILQCEEYKTCTWRNCSECNREKSITKRTVLEAPTIVEAGRS